MSETSDRTSCISHRALVHYFVMYEDFLEVAKVSEHQYKLAAFWRVLETKTNDRITYNEGAKEKGQPVLDLWIEIPYSEFVNRSLGTYKASSFQVAAAESERLGFSKSRVGKRPRNPLDPDSPKDEYKEYLLLTGTLQKTINTGEYPTPIEINSPLLKSISARKEAKKQKKAIENNRDGIEINSPPVEINTIPIEINRNNNITESSNISKIKDTSDDVASANHHDTPASFSQGSSPDLSTQANAVENTGQLADSSTVSQHAAMASSGACTTLETPSPSQMENDMGENALSQKTPYDVSTVMPLSKTEVTSQNEVLQASNGQSPIAAVATRNSDEEHATLSWSGEDATAGNGVPTTPPETGAKGRNKRARTPEDETVKARVERVFAYFDKLKQETTGNPEERYVQTKAAAKEIKETLLPCGPTELKLRKVYLKLWNTPPSKGGDFHWKDHMTIKAVCGQYESMTLALDAEENAEAEKKRAKQLLESVVKNPPILVQAEDDYVFDLERVRGNRGRRSAS